MPTSAARVQAARVSSAGRGSVETVNTGAEVSTDAGTAGSNAYVATGMELAGSSSRTDACDGSNAVAEGDGSPIAFVLSTRGEAACGAGLGLSRDPRRPAATGLGPGSVR